MKHTFLACVLTASLVLPTGSTAVAADNDTEEFIGSDEDAPASRPAISHKKHIVLGVGIVSRVTALKITLFQGLHLS